MTPAQVALARAQARLVGRVTQLETQLDAGDADVWRAYCEAAAALASISSTSTPEARGALLTTAELADRLQLSPRTIRRKVKDGTLTPQRFGQRGRGALRWPRAEGATR